MCAQQILSTNTFTAATWIVNTDATKGTHTTLAGALSSASSGDTILLQSSVTENPTLKAGVNIVAFIGSGDRPNISITGKCTATFSGTCSISGIQLITNSDYFLVVSGSNATIVNLDYCSLNCLNNTGINYTSSSANSSININYCTGNLATTGIGFCTGAGAGILAIFWCLFSNTGASTTATTLSAASFQIFFSDISNIVSTTGTATFSFVGSTFNCGSLNATPITANGTGNSTIFSCYLASGTASSLSIGAGANVTMSHSLSGSSNTNAWTGAGTLNTFANTFTGTSHFSNVTTQTGGAINGLTQGTAPSAGMIGERIESIVGSQATASTIPISITSITLTPGIWDVSLITACVPTGGTATAIAFVAGISTTINTFTGNLGSEYSQINATGGPFTLTVPALRKTISANTTYYLTVETVFTSTTCPCNGRISAVRVG